MKTLLLLAAIAFSEGAAAPSRVARRPMASPCRAADENTQAEIDLLRGAMRGDHRDTLWLRRIGLPSVPDTAFEVIRDTGRCQQALAAHNREMDYTPAELATPAARSVYVLRVGAYFITSNPDFPSGEFVNHALWTTSWRLVGHFFF